MFFQDFVNYLYFYVKIILSVYILLYFKFWKEF